MKFPITPLNKLPNKQTYTTSLAVFKEYKLIISVIAPKFLGYPSLLLFRRNRSLSEYSIKGFLCLKFPLL